MSVASEDEGAADQDARDNYAALRAALFVGPAPYANRFHFQQFGSVVRLSFGEQYDPAVVPTYRAGITLELNEAKDLVRILGSLLGDIDARRDAELAGDTGPVDGQP